MSDDAKIVPFARPGAAPIEFPRVVIVHRQDSDGTWIDLVGPFADTDEVDAWVAQSNIAPDKQVDGPDDIEHASLEDEDEDFSVVLGWHSTVVLPPMKAYHK